MKRALLKTIAFLLCLTFLTGIFPADQISNILPLNSVLAEASTETQLQALEEQADATAETVDAALRKEDLLSRAESVLEEEGERISGAWRYAVLREESWAVITGYDGDDTQEIEVPAFLDGFDVVALADGALSDLKNLRQVTLPINILAMGKNALPDGSVVRANHGLYAETLARKTGHAFVSASEYDFVSGVVDLTGVLSENFYRVSEHEIWFRPLEARQLTVGSRFFLLDPDNKYQISYYQATDMSETRDGFVVVRCSTPDVKSILYHYTSENEKMMVDCSTIKLAEGATSNTLRTKSRGANITMQTDVLNFGLTVNPMDLYRLTGKSTNLDITYHQEIDTSFVGSLTFGFGEPFELKIDQTTSETQTLKVSTKLAKDEQSSEYKEELKNRLMQYTQHGRPNYNYHDSIDIPVGSAVIFSVGGIINTVVTLRFEFTFEGELKLTHSSSTTTTMLIREGQDVKTTTTKNAEKNEGSVNAKIKAGASLSMEVYLFSLRAAYISAFLGIEINAKMDLNDLFELMQALGGTLVDGDSFNLDHYINVNMADTIDVTCNLILEVKAGIGAGEVFNAETKMRILDIPIAHWHYHLLPDVFQVNADNDSDSGQQQVLYTYTRAGKKIIFHNADDCPYETKSVRFYLENVSEPICEKVNLEPGTKVADPRGLMDRYGFGYGLKFEGWYGSPDLTSETLFEDWPLIVTENMNFYAKTSPYHKVLLMDMNGQMLECSGQFVHDTFTGKNRDYDKDNKLVAEDDEFIFPETLPDGTEAKGWVKVSSENEEGLELSEHVYKPGDKYRPDSEDGKDIIFCAVTDKDVIARFYVKGKLYDTKTAQQGESIIAADEPTEIGRYEFLGWVQVSAKGGKPAANSPRINPGDPILTNENSETFLYFNADLKYNGQSTEIAPGEMVIGKRDHPMQNPVSGPEMFETEPYSILGVSIPTALVIKGFNSDYDGSTEYVEVPSAINGKTVAKIANGAFANRDDLKLLVISGDISLGEGMVANCPNLEKIDLGGTSIQRIPTNFAKNDTALVSVILPETITELGDYAFSGCSSISGATIATNLGTKVFENCTQMTSATLGLGVTSIGDYAFIGCTALETLALPDTLGTSEEENAPPALGTEIAKGCTALKTLKMEGPRTLTSGHLIDSASNHIENLILGEGLEEIGSYALSGFGALKTLTLPSTLKKIGSNAFNGAGVEELTISLASGADITDAFRGMDQLKTLTITAGWAGTRSFYDLDALETVNIGADVVGIGDYCFANCDNLKTVNLEEGLTYIDEYAFRNCSSLESLSIPDSVTDLGMYFLSGCIGLKTLSVGAALNHVKGNDNAFVIGQGSLLETLEIRDTADHIAAFVFSNQPFNGASYDPGFKNLETLIIGANVRWIGGYAFRGVGVRTLVLNGSMDIYEETFSNCPRLETLVLGGGEMGDYAFARNTKLKHVEITRGEVGPHAFEDCTNLESVTLGDGVRSIGYSAFYECTNLTDINLGEGVRSIGSYAFDGCSSLTSLTFPDSVVYYGNGLIRDCLSLTELTVGGGQSVLSCSFYGGYRDTGPFDIGKGSQLQKLTIREGVTELYGVFCNFDTYYDSYGYQGYPYLKAVNLPRSLRVIKEEFYYSGIEELIFKGDIEIASRDYREQDHCMPNLRHVLIPGGTIGEYAFSNYPALTTVDLGNRVTYISRNAFLNCSSLKRLVIPDSVETIEDDSLTGCSGLEYLSVGTAADQLCTGYLGDDSQLKTVIIRDGATKIRGDFLEAYSDYLKNLETVSIPASVTSIGGGAFQGSGVRQLIIAGEPTIGNYAFANCTRLETITLSDSDVGEGAFSGCVNLKKAELLSGTLGYNAFSGCVSLTEIHLGDGVTKLDTHAFLNCSSLKSLVIPDSVTSYGAGIIKGCTGLEYLSVGGGVTELKIEWQSESPFTIGPDASLRRIDIAEGVTRIYQNVFNNRWANGGAGGNDGFPTLTEVNLPKSLKTLDSAFSETGLQQLILRGVPEYVAGFSNMATLETVLIEGGTIKPYTFQNCKNLTTVKLGAEVNEIGEGAFMGCENLAEVWIGANTTVGNRAFEGCPKAVYHGAWNDNSVNVRFAVNTPGFTADNTLPDGFTLYQTVNGVTWETLTLPQAPVQAGMSFLGWYLDPGFGQACNLETMPEEDTVIFGRMEPIPAGATFRETADGLELKAFILLEGESATVFLPTEIEGVPLVSIAAGAFSGSGVRNLVISSSVTNIEPGAFAGSNLRNIRVNTANPAYATEGGVLYTKDMKTLVCYPPRKEGSMFSYAYGDSYTRIEAYAFAGCDQLETIYFPYSLTEIGESAFSDCTRLGSIDLNQVTTVRRLAFEGCTGIYYLRAMNLTTLESTGLANDTLPRGNGIQVYGPVGQGVLRDYYVSTDKDGREYPVSYNRYRLELSMNGQYETMGCEAGFPLPQMLAEVTGPDGNYVTGWYQSSSPDTLWDLEHDLMPARDLTLFARYTTLFEYQTRSVDNGNGGTVYGAVLTGWNGTGNTLSVPATLQGYNVVGLDEGFFTDTRNAAKITIPSSVIWFAETGTLNGTVVADADSAAALWANAHGLDLDYILYTLTLDSQLGEPLQPINAAKGTTIRLPAAERAGMTFEGWYRSGNYPVSLNENGLYVMPGEDTTIYARWSGTEENVPFTWTAKNRQVTIKSYTGREKTVVIPATINGWPVVEIGPSAFEGKTITSVDLGPVQTIGENAFRDCAALARVNLRQVTSIGDSAFAGCSMLMGAALPDTLTSIGNNAFLGCAKLPEIVIPDSVTELGRSAFADCAILRRAMLGAGVLTLGTDIFSGCGKLESIQVNNDAFRSADGVLLDAYGSTLILYPAGRTDPTYQVPEGISSIGDRAFSGAKHLQTVALPSSVWMIGNQAFLGSGITEINLELVQVIGSSAFFGCENLTEITLGSYSTIGNFAFVNCPALAEAYIPADVSMNTEESYFDTNTGLVIIGKTASPAETYALIQGINFRDPDVAGVSALEISESEITLNRGARITLTATTTPAAATVTWYSSNPDVATVDEDGLVLAVGCGIAQIIARTTNGLTAACKVTIEAPIQQILVPTFVQVIPGGRTCLAVQFLPANPSDTEIMWQSADETIATVDDEGWITGIAVGKTTITVTAQNGVSAAIAVTVPDELRIFDYVDMAPGQKGKISLRNVGNSGLAYQSTNTYVFTVDHTGQITARTTGTATLKVTDGYRQAECIIRVSNMSPLTMPEMLTQVAEQAFEGDNAVECIVLGNNVRQIGDHAFANMSALKQVEFDGMSVEIHPAAFINSNPTILCPAGSDAEAWAVSQDVRYMTK